jgi:cell surface protein SprA
MLQMAFIMQDHLLLGIFSISTVLIKTSFAASDEFGSQSFDDFRVKSSHSRKSITERRIDINNPSNRDAEGFPLGFGKNKSGSLLPAFMAAYTGGNATDDSLGIFRSFPIPNCYKYNGLRYGVF